MNQQRMVFCKKLKEELPGLPFKPFTDEFGQVVYDNVSMQAWQMWLQESPRYINTRGVDLNTEEGRSFLRDQMKVFFGLAEGKMADTAWVPPEKS